MESKEQCEGRGRRRTHTQTKRSDSVLRETLKMCLYLCGRYWLSEAARGNGTNVLAEKRLKI